MPGNSYYGNGERATMQQEANQITLETATQFVKGVGPARAKGFVELGVETVGDLFAFFRFSSIIFSYNFLEWYIVVCYFCNRLTCVLFTTIIRRLKLFI